MPNFLQLEEFLEKYFPDQLTGKQMEQFRAAHEGWITWNERVNLISRKDLENLAERHILHSLSIAKRIQFKPGTRILDVGTGGGFPGLPLAIFFPESEFVLVDSIAKKIKVVNAISEACALTNLTATHIRAEKVDGQFDFVVSRAVARFEKFLPWVRGKVHCRNKNKLKNGILYLKGDTVEEEIEAVRGKIRKPTVYFLSDDFEEPFFSSKRLVHIPFCK